MTKSLLPALVLTALTAACSSSPTADGDASGADNTASTSEPIISGTPSTPSQDAVVLLMHTDNKTYTAVCSGTLIAPNLVLTARHCVSETGSGAFGCDKDGNLVNDGSGGGAVGADFNPAEIYVFTGSTRPNFEGGGTIQADAIGKKIFHDNAKVVCSHDLSLLLLNRDLPAASIAPLRLDPRTAKGEKITAVGWGVTLDTEFPTQRQQRTGIPIVQIGPYSDPTVDVPPNDFLVGEATCSGDSGGPAFSEDTGAVIGVVSRGGNGKDDSPSPSNACTNADNDYTQTAPFKSLITTALKEAGHEAVVEPGGSDSGGGGCSVGRGRESSRAPTPTSGAGAVVALGIAVTALRRRRR